MPKVTRSAVTGQFVKKSKAKSKPKTTVSETVKRWPDAMVHDILLRFVKDDDYHFIHANNDLKKLLDK